MADFQIIACKNEECGSEFKVQGWEQKAGRRFCSRECFNAFQLRQNVMARDEIGTGMGGEDR